ncbi:hypothetical protein [Streptomyces sp. NPDC021020]|uniref:hypothetical protein n=1 Tax=Streptomyces sp. NPDC021020 TaxID=3365109 RepID=UPI0037ADDE73
MEQWQGQETGGRAAGPNQWVKDQIDAMIDAAPMPPIPPQGPMGRGCRALRSALRRGRAARAAAAPPAVR